MDPQNQRYLNVLNVLNVLDVLNVLVVSAIPRAAHSAAGRNISRV